MNKLILVIVILILGAGGALAAGYRFHPEHLGYYLKMDASTPQKEIIFKDGRTFKASVLKESGDEVKINMEGASMTFSKSEIEAMNPLKSKGLIENLQDNYQRHHKLHALITHSKDKSVSGAFDNFLGESDRISEKIRQDHPELTSQALVQQAQAAQALAKARQAHLEAEIRKSQEGGEGY